MTTWRKEIMDTMKDTGEKSIIFCTLSDEELDEEFYEGYGGSCGKPFTAWGEKYVYFPIVYDGAEWVGYAPRDPCEEATEHQGGE